MKKSRAHPRRPESIRALRSNSSASHDCLKEHARLVPSGLQRVRRTRRALTTQRWEGLALVAWPVAADAHVVDSSPDSNAAFPPQWVRFATVIHLVLAAERIE